MRAYYKDKQGNSKNLNDNKLKTKTSIANISFGYANKILIK